MEGLSMTLGLEEVFAGCETDDVVPPQLLLYGMFVVLTMT